MTNWGRPGPWPWSQLVHTSLFVFAGCDPADKSALTERQLIQEFPKLLFHLQQKEKNRKVRGGKQQNYRQKAEGIKIFCDFKNAKQGQLYDSIVGCHGCFLSQTMEKKNIKRLTGTYSVTVQEIIINRSMKHWSHTNNYGSWRCELDLAVSLLPCPLSQPFD